MHFFLAAVHPTSFQTPKPALLSESLDRHSCDSLKNALLEQLAQQIRLLHSCKAGFGEGSVLVSIILSDHVKIVLHAHTRTPNSPDTVSTEHTDTTAVIASKP